MLAILIIVQNVSSESCRYTYPKDTRITTLEHFQKKIVPPGRTNPSHTSQTKTLIL